MPTLKYAKVLITRNPMEKIAKTVALHEVPILKDIHGEDAVEVKGTVSSTRAVPEVKDEFQRLQALYGRHHSVNIPYVEHVYGGALSGGLAKALKAATDKADAVKGNEAPPTTGDADPDTGTESGEGDDGNEAPPTTGDAATA